MSFMRREHSLALVPLLALALGGCGSDDADDDAIAQIEIQPTDAVSADGIGPEGMKPVPHGSGSRLWVTLEEVRVRVIPDDPHAFDQVPDLPDEPEAGDDDLGEKAEGQTTIADDESGRWLLASAGAQRIDLFDVTPSTRFLGNVGTPKGRLTQVRLVLADDAALSTFEGDVPVRCPACGTRGLKVRVDEPVALDAERMVRVILLFGLNESLWKGQDSGDYVLSPVIDVRVTAMD